MGLQARKGVTTGRYRLVAWRSLDGRLRLYREGITHESRMDRTISERKLEEKILQVNSALGRALSWYQDATFVTKTILINMTFNMGLVGVLKFKNTLAYIKAQNYTQAAANMEKSLWYRQVGVRARELVKRMRTQTIEPQHAAQEKI